MIFSSSPKIHLWLFQDTRQHASFACTMYGGERSSLVAGDAGSMVHTMCCGPHGLAHREGDVQLMPTCRKGANFFTMQCAHSFAPREVLKAHGLLLVVI